MNKRTSGVLLPVFSLPSQFGIGSLGAAAKKFVLELERAKQSYWQILPLTLPDFVNSPYASPSAFAGNYWLIDIDELMSEGYLSKSSVDLYRGQFFKKVDYIYTREIKTKLYTEAYNNFKMADKEEDYYSFIEENKFWLDDYLLYISAKEYFGDKAWYEWDDISLRYHKKSALEKYRKLLDDRISYHLFLQYVFYKQFYRLKAFMHEHSIELIGDLPFYVSYDSADVWAKSEMFLLDRELSPKVVAGVPPDFFSCEGQLWGNPIYNYNKMKDDGFEWFLYRFRHVEKLFDVTRIDHFRAFDTYYTVEYGRIDAREGEWEKGIGREFFKILYEKVPNVRLVAEDLGELFDTVHQLRREFCLAGMKVIQFAFDSDADNDFLPHNYTRDCVAYLGTHDNNTTVGWLGDCPLWKKEKVLAYLGISDTNATNEEICEKMFSYLASSVAETVIFTVQDILKLPSEYRTNIPSLIGGCWEYMIQPGQLGESDFACLKYYTELYGRDNRRLNDTDDREEAALIN